jgi:hypothetical protein
MTTNRLWVIGLSAAIIAVLALGWFLLIAPFLAAAQLAADEVASVRDQNLAQQTALISLKDQFEHLDELKAELGDLEAAVPSDEELFDFVDELTRQAADTGVVLDTYTASEALPWGSQYVTTATGSAAETPATPDPAATPPATDPSVSATVPGPGAGIAGLESKLYTIGVSIGVKGTPAQVLAYVNAMQLQNRYFLVTNVAFSGGVTTDPAGTLTGFLLVLNDPAATPPAPTSESPAPSATSTPTPSATTETPAAG